LKSFIRFALGIWAFSCLHGVADSKLKVGLVLDKGGKDDKSFNAAAFKGATEAQGKFNVNVKTVESSDDSSLEPALRTFAENGYDLVIGIGFVQNAAITKVAKEFPKISFVLVDSLVNLPNVRSILFSEHEGSFLVGAIGALTTKTNTIGFIGGMDVPLIRRFELGYRSGAQYINKNIQIIANYVGSGSDAWRNPTKGKELALSQYEKKADAIFAAAGASALGVFDAAEEQKKYVIGCDSNQNWIKPGRVLTSMVKRVDTAVYKVIEEKTLGKFEAGEFVLGLKEGGVDYVIDNFNRALIPAPVEKRIKKIKSDIIAGRIKVPDFYVTRQIAVNK
jgi:basic membrane protein A and related proteins